jgi:hypothetical protein
MTMREKMARAMKKRAHTPPRASFKDYADICLDVLMEPTEDVFLKVFEAYSGASDRPMDDSDRDYLKDMNRRFMQAAKDGK